MKRRRLAAALAVGGIFVGAELVLAHLVVRCTALYLVETTRQIATIAGK